MDEIRNAAAYIRVSTEDQTEYSPDAQLRARCIVSPKNRTCKMIC